MAFQMLSWGDPERGWLPMENGAAPKVWRPRKTEAEAIAKTMAWTGFLFIPAMQVVDLDSGRVCFRGLSTPFHFDEEWHFEEPEAGPPIRSTFEPLAEQMARQILHRPEPVLPEIFDDQPALF